MDRGICTAMVLVLYGAMHILRLDIRDPGILEIVLATVLALACITRRWARPEITEDWLRKHEGQGR